MCPTLGLLYIIPVLHNISASTIQSLYQVLPCGQATKDEFLTNCGVLSHCDLASALADLIMPIARNMCFLTSQHPLSCPSTRCYPMGMLPRLNSLTCGVCDMFFSNISLCHNIYSSPYILSSPSI